MKLTIEDIARLSGFSRATVCRAIAGSSSVKEATRQKIYQVMKENHYRTNEWETADQQREKTMAIIVGDILDAESSFQNMHPLIIRTLLRRMEEHGYNCYLFNSEYSMKKEDEYLQKSVALHVSGIFMLSATGSLPQLQKVADQNIPVVAINRDIKMPFADRVLIDEYQCAYIAVKYLYELGHTNIGLVNEPRNTPLAYETEGGFLDTVKQLKIASNAKNIFKSAASFEGGYEVGKQILTQRRDITGLFCVGYDMASGIQAAYQEAGLSIPGDLSLVVFQYSLEQVRRHKRKFTSVGAYSLEDIAHTAADTMLQRLSEPNPSGRNLNVVMETNFVIGGSTAEFESKS